MVWSHSGRFNGNGAIQDSAKPAQLNRLDGYSAHGWKVPYPGDAAILSPLKIHGTRPKPRQMGPRLRVS